MRANKYENLFILFVGFFSPLALSLLLLGLWFLFDGEGEISIEQKATVCECVCE